MKRGQDIVTANKAYFGAGTIRSGASFDGVTPAMAVSVHANVDAPFKPLIPFVPTEYWDACERRKTAFWPTLAARFRRLAAMGRGRVATAMRRVRH